MTIIEARKRASEICANVLEEGLGDEIEQVFSTWYYDDGSKMSEQDNERMNRAVKQIAHRIRVMYRPKRVVYKP